MQPVKIGVIGCGVISASHLKLIRDCPDAEAVAVADLIDERVKSRAVEFEVPATYPNDEALLADETVEAVILAMPTGVRTPVAFKALELGKHVLLEKPVASKAGEVERLIAMRKDRVVACCSSRMSFTGHAAAARRCVESGALGDIRLIRIRAVHGAAANPNDNPPPWRESMELNGGGILVNWSCYELDYMMHITGWKPIPTAVSANWWPVASAMKKYAAGGSDADAHYIALVQCKDSISLSMERAEFSSTTTDRSWTIVGTEGTLHMPMQEPSADPNAVVLDKFVPGEGITSETLWAPEDSSSSGGNVITDFVDAIRTGSPPRTGMEQALVMQKITDAIYKSAQTGTSIAIA